MTASQILDMIAPGFAADPNKANFLTLAATRTSAAAFGAVKYPEAVALRAAHMMTLRDRVTGDGGQIQSKREGSLAVSFAATSGGAGANADLALTHYGQQLLGLINGSILKVGVSGEAFDGSISDD